MRINCSVLVALICGTVLVFLIAAVCAGSADEFDIAVLQLALTFDTPSAVAIWKTITFFGSAATIAALSLAALVGFTFFERLNDALHFAVVMIGTVIIENAMKLSIHRTRPAEVFANTLPASSSFPSGHTLFATAFYVSFALIAFRRTAKSKRIAAAFAAATIILAVGMSRIFLGVHYPSDVLGGYLTAALWIAVLSHARQNYV
jgi:undecaprenyl-diphosphatase